MKVASSSLLHGVDLIKIISCDNLSLAGIGSHSHMINCYVCIMCNTWLERTCTLTFLVTNKGGLSMKSIILYLTNSVYCSTSASK